MPGKMKNYGGDLPSPRQSYEAMSRRPSSAGGERDARIRAYMSRMQEPGMSDVPGMTPEEIAPYNQPAMDINDVFFGPNRKRFDIVEFIANLVGGR
jgi:hypothetical protein